MTPARLQALLMLLFAALASSRLLRAADRYDSAFPPSLEVSLIEDMTDGRLDRFTLLEASLIAGGIDTSDELRIQERRFAEASRVMNIVPAPGQDSASEAAAILEELHRHVLTGAYLPLCTQLHRTLQNGDYNCVTATILFRCLAEPRGLEVTTWGEPGHVFCRLEGSAPVIIQTTSPRGVLAEQVPAAAAEGPVDEADAQARGRALSDVQLVAKIYYNRGVALLEHDAFAAALPLLMRAAELDEEDPAARRNLLACLNNWAVSECRCGRFEKALRLLAQGHALSPDYPDFLGNEIYVYCSWARKLTVEQRYAEAIEVLETASNRRPEVSLFRDGQARIYEVWSHARQPASSGNTM